MKEGGESISKHDLPEDSDMVAEILRAPKAGERMDSELFARLATK